MNKTIWAFVRTILVRVVSARTTEQNTSTTPHSANSATAYPGNAQSVEAGEIYKARNEISDRWYPR
jgi:hypothetical protein